MMRVMILVIMRGFMIVMMRVIMMVMMRVIVCDDEGEDASDDGGGL